MIFLGQKFGHIHRAASPSRVVDIADARSHDAERGPTADPDRRHISLKHELHWRGRVSSRIHDVRRIGVLKLDGRVFLFSMVGIPE